MLKVIGGLENAETVFECLDISGCDCLNVEGIKNIINEFKIIKELNLSHSKYFENIPTTNFKPNNYNHPEYLIDDFLINSDFLKNICLRYTTDEEAKHSGFIINNSIEPILSTLYLYETPITTDTMNELILLYKVFFNKI
jgi:hypothetical protein